MPITGLYAGALALVLIALSLRVVIVVRAREKIGYGDGGRADMATIVRGQGNFVEYVPLALVLIGIAELDGAGTQLLHGLGLTLLVARILHPFGLTPPGGTHPLRVVGILATWIVLVVGGLRAILSFFG